MLEQGGAGGQRQRLLVREVGGRRDELAEGLEIAQLQIRRLPEERVDVWRELLEVHPRHVAVIATGAQLERALGSAPALPEPPHHVRQPTGRDAQRADAACTGFAGPLR
jgi:hypothetical protein